MILLALFIFTASLLFSQENSDDVKLSSYHLVSLDCINITDEYEQRKCTGQKTQQLLNKEIDLDIFTKHVPENEILRINFSLIISENGDITPVTIQTENQLFKEEVEKALTIAYNSCRFITEDGNFIKGMHRSYLEITVRE